MVECTLASKYGELPTPVYLKYGENIGSGGFSVVYRTIASTRQEMSHTASLAHKLYKWGSVEKYIKHSQEMHTYFKECGLQVPPTYRETPDGLLMTDLTEKGKQLVLSINDSSTKVNNLKYSKQDLLEAFRNLNLFQLRREYLSDFSKANDAGILFGSAGCWFLVLSELNEYRLVHADFDEVTVTKRNKDKEALNEEWLQQFMYRLLLMQETVKL